MVTTFNELRTLIRPLVGDNDPNVQQYSNDVLNSHIRLVILRADDPDIQEIGTSEQFTKTLSNKNKALMVYLVAQSLISNVPGHFSYKTPVLSVVRRGGIPQLLAHLEEQIAAIEGGSFAASDDQFIDAFIRGTERFIDEFSNA